MTYRLSNITCPATNLMFAIPKCLTDIWMYNDEPVKHNKTLLRFFIVLGQHVSILIESSSGPSKKIDPYLKCLGSSSLIKIDCFSLTIYKFNVCHINIQWCVRQTQQIFIMFIIVLGDPTAHY